MLDYTYSMIPPTLKVEFATLEEDVIDGSERDETQLHCTQEQLKLPPGSPGACEEYLSFDYEAMGEVFVTRRSYKSIMSILGEFGGILKVITTTTFFLYGLYNMRKIKYILGDLIFKSDQDTTKQLKQIINSKNNRKQRKEQELTQQNTAANVNSVRQTLTQKRVTETHNTPKLNEVVQELVKTRSNVEDLMRKLNLLELIEKAIFKDHERQLLPLVLLKVKQREMMEEKALDSKSNHAHHSSNAIFAKKSLEDSSQKNPFESAYTALVKSDPDDDFSKKIKAYILGELKGVFNMKNNKNNIHHQNQEKIKLRRSMLLKAKQKHQVQTMLEDEESRIEVSKKNEAQSAVLPLKKKYLQKLSLKGFLRPTNSPRRLVSRMSSRSINRGQNSPTSKIGKTPRPSQFVD